VKADKTSHSGGMHDMEKRFWFCPTSSYRCGAMVGMPFHHDHGLSNLFTSNSLEI
jgi:hypothetical protein